MLMIDQTYDGRSVTLPVGQVLELRLPENPTTGYSWSVESAGGPVCAVAGNAFEPGGTRPGAGGEHTWRIRGVQAGDCQIALAYRRSFEDARAPARTFRVGVQVTP